MKMRGRDSENGVFATFSTPMAASRTPSSLSTIFLVVIMLSFQTVMSFVSTATTIQSQSITLTSTKSAVPSSSRRAFLRYPSLWRRGGGGGADSSKQQQQQQQQRQQQTPQLSATATSTTAGAAVSAENLALLSDRGRAALDHLLAYDKDKQSQTHVYGDWPPPGDEDDGKRQLCEQLADLDESYPGGLPAYLEKATVLLKESEAGLNPFADFIAKVPSGESLSFEDAAKSTMDWNEAERLGMEASKGAVFVLVAGGLGERLGYSGIKLSLESNLLTNTCYLQVYIKYILAMQYRARQLTGEDSIRIPLVIMTSGDTDAPTRELIASNNNFGLDDDMLTIVTQDKVAALGDGKAGLALNAKNRWSIQTKPHGHGDVHQLLHREGLVEKWRAQGKTHAVFLQDTNALVINSVVPTLGVSVAKGFDMNSICIPRLAGEEAGAIATLEHRTDPNKSLVINVEYNQLDPLLRAQSSGDEGDVPDPQTGYSPFPGNANNIVIALDAYGKTLAGEDQGVVLEFVNPKYADETKTTFKKPTRLECMMQDIPKLFQKEMGQDVNIGFTMFDRWFTFSPAKNALDAGQAAVAASGKSCAPGTMSSAESDKYIQNQRKLAFAGCKIDVTSEEADLEMLAGIAVTPGPRIILCPAFAITKEDILDKIKPAASEDIVITTRSSLILEGHNLTIEKLQLDGALIIRTGPETHLTVKGLNVANAGWEFCELDPAKEYPEHVQIRGYVNERKQTAEYILDEPGHFVLDESGEVKKV